MRATATRSASPTIPAATGTARSARDRRARNGWPTAQAELLPVPYFHVVFTLPAPIAAVALQNKAVVYDILFKAAAETVRTIAADPKHLGAETGMIAVLHTWGQPAARPSQAPVGAQDAQQLRREHDVAVLATLAPLDPDQHPAAVNLASLKAGHLADPQAGPIGRGQRGTVAQPGHRLQERTISSALSTTGSFWGSRALTMPANTSLRPSVTP